MDLTTMLGASHLLVFYHQVITCTFYTEW